MTDDDLMTTIRASTSEPWWKRRWKNFVEYWKGSTSRINVLIACVFATVGWFLLRDQQSTLNAAQREADQHATEQAMYQAALTNYTQAVGAYTLCVDSVGRSDANRGQWEQLVEVIRALGPNAADFADQLAAGPLLSSQPRVLDDCTDPGPPPDPPKED